MEHSVFGRITAGFDITFDDFHENETAGLAAQWIIRRRDIFLISSFFNMAQCDTILDAGCGCGFISWLLAMEGIPVVGVDTCDDLEDSPFSHSLLNLKKYDLEGGGENLQCDGVLFSWPLRNEKPAKIVMDLKPRAAIYVVNMEGRTGDREGHYLRDIIPAYRPFVYWDNVCHTDINPQIFRSVNSGVEGGITPLSLKTSRNRVIVFLKRDLNLEEIDPAILETAGESVQPYAWEEELDRYYRIGERLEGGRKILWKPRLVEDENELLKQISQSSLLNKGLGL